MKLSEAERDLLRFLNGERREGCTVDVRTLEAIACLHNRGLASPNYGSIFGSYAVTPAGLKALEEE